MPRYPVISIWGVLLLIIATQLALSQSQEFKFRHITPKEGLSSNYIRCIIKDSKGFMWFGTVGGLNRYDGYNVKAYKNDPNDSTSISRNSIMALVEYTNGDLLVGTINGGLNRFHAATETFSHYTHNPDDPTSISHDRVNIIYQDNQDLIWVGTHDGLNLFDPSSGRFNVFQQDPLYPGNKKDQVQVIFQDKEGMLWIGTNGGLYQFDRQRKVFKEIELVLPVEPIENWHKIINCIAEDHNGVLWIGTDHLLFKYDNGKLEWVPPNKNRSKYPSNYHITDIVEYKDADGYYLWIATWWGLNAYEFNSGLYHRVHTDPTNPESLSSDHVNALFLDDSGLLWIAGPDGIDIFDLRLKPFNQVFMSHGINQHSYSAVTFYEDEDSNLWIGSPNGGLIKYDQQLNFMKRFNLRFDDRLILNYSVFKILEDSKHRLWIGMNRPYAGIYLFDRDEESVTKLKFNIPEDQLLPEGINDILENNMGVIWVATNRGLFWFDGKKQVPEPLRMANHDKLSDSWISDLYKDDFGIVWIASNKGLFRMNELSSDSITFQRVGDCNNDSRCLKGNPKCIFESKNGTFWVGTTEGLFMMNESHEFIEVYEKNELIGENSILSIVEDDNGYLWMNTWKGIVMFKPDIIPGETPKLFDLSDGLPFEKHITTPLFKSSDGQIFVPGRGAQQNGFYYFHPDSITINTQIPPVFITDLKIRNEPYVTDTNITMLKQLTLSYNQNYLTLEFAALDYMNPGKNQYAYQLEGIDNDWVYCGNRRYANYTGISPGDYIFSVKGSNNDGYWNEAGTSLAITILPPPWRTWWAYSLYALFLLGLIVAWRRYDLKRQRLKQDLELEQVEAEKLKEMDKIKSRFFANISHEFRTPLTLILGPLEKLRKVVLEEGLPDLEMMQRNARRLQRLINQLLSLSKLESGEMRLQVREVNLVELVNGYVQSFESLAKQRNIDLVFQAEEKDIQVYIDQEKLEKILYNLLSNAFKFTSEGGLIKIEVGSGQLAIGSERGQRDKGTKGQFTTAPLHHSTTTPTTSPHHHTTIRISDTGPGIPPDHLSHIFDRFYQADDSYTRDQEGTGIGLALTKELVELHQGTIYVESEVGKGTTFRVILPLGKEHLNEEEVNVQDGMSNIEHRISNIEHRQSTIDNRSKTEFDGANQSYPTPGPSPTREGSKPPLGGLGVGNEQPLLLIVEDNTDLRAYIRSYLDESYHITEARDGNEGLKKATEEIPDLILSDVMMPGMDGFELCEKLKTDERTSHIPVILLTARAAPESKLEGLETGADDFLTKPFDPDELQIRIRNLIAGRERLRERYLREMGIEDLPKKEKTREKELISLDEKFLIRAKSIIEDHLSDETFDIPRFSEKMYLSRTQLHRKLKALVNQSATEFIRAIRLHHAARLLEHKTGNISEIALEVGFSNPAYFAECFKKQFGLLPSEFIKNL